MEVSLSTKYQLVIPKGVRKTYNLRSGQKFQVIAKDGVIILVPDRPLKELRGIFQGMTTKDLREEKERIV